MAQPGQHLEAEGQSSYDCSHAAWPSVQTPVTAAMASSNCKIAEGHATGATGVTDVKGDHHPKFATKYRRTARTDPSGALRERSWVPVFLHFLQDRQQETISQLICSLPDGN